MLSRGLCDDRSSSPTGAGRVTNAIMVDATMNASFDRNWACPGARNAANVRSTWIRKVARSSRANFKVEVGPSSSPRPTPRSTTERDIQSAGSSPRESLSLNFRRQAFRKLPRCITASLAICSEMFGPNPQPLTTNSTSSPRAGLGSGQIASRRSILRRLLAGRYASMTKAPESLGTSWRNPLPVRDPASERVSTQPRCLSCGRN